MAEEEKKQEEVNEEKDTSAEDVKTEQDESKDNSNMIPYDRFQQVIEEKNEYKNKLERMQEKLESMDDPEEIKKEYEEEMEQLSSKVEQSKKEYALKTQALKEGVAEEALDDFVKVADLSVLEVEENDVKNVQDLVNDMKENKGYFFNEKENGNVGKKTNPGEQNNPDEEKKKLEKYFGLK